MGQSPRGFRRPPLDTTLLLPGIEVHSSWFGGTLRPYQRQWTVAGASRYGIALGRDGNEAAAYYGQAQSDRDAYYPDGQLVGGPRYATQLSELFTRLAGWKFYGAFSGWPFSPASPPLSAFDIGRDMYSQGLEALFPDPGQRLLDYATYPFWQHVVLAKATGTTRAGGKPPLVYFYDFISFAAYTWADEVADQHFATVLVVLDGTGSYGTYKTLTATMLARALAARSPSTRLLVVQFSDYSDSSATFDQQDYLATVGSWPSVDAGTEAQVNAACQGTSTGNGGDAPEAQFEGIAYGLAVAERMGWNTGRRAVVVGTDTCSATVIGRGGEGAHLRLRQRDDDTGPSPAPALGHRSSSSANPGRAPRIGRAARYD